MTRIDVESDFARVLGGATHCILRKRLARDENKDFPYNEYSVRAMQLLFSVDSIKIVWYSIARYEYARVFKPR